MSTVERFLNKVEPGENGCWLWTGNLTSSGAHGYGRFSIAGEMVLAHRWLYEQMVGPIPEGLSLDHLCRHPRCVYPLHLEPVTHAENVRRGAAPTADNARKSTCPSGHAYDATDSRGARLCMTCERARKRRYEDRRKATRKAVAA